jgi:CDP-diacylglycerol--glycerol-3-phosphate 3-phosphatidyltransferase
MRSLYAFKPGFQAVLRPLVGRLARSSITPNFITLASLTICAGYGALLAVTGSRTAFLLLPVILLLRMALNAIDGMLAREHGQASVLGARLNELGDVISDICLYLPFVALVRPAALVVAVVMAGMLTEFAGVLGCAQGGARNYDGPFGKSDRAVFFAVIAIALVVLSPAAVVVNSAFVLAAAGGMITTVSRLMQGAPPCRN